MFKYRIGTKVSFPQYTDDDGNKPMRGYLYEVNEANNTYTIMWYNYCGEKEAPCTYGGDPSISFVWEKTKPIIVINKQ